MDFSKNLIPFECLLKDKNIKTLKRELEGWREIILHANSILLWEKNWHPGLITGVSTIFFFIIWLLDPSLLTAVSGACLLVTLVDYIVPAISANIFNPVNWTGVKEKQLEDVCKAIVANKTLIVCAWNEFRDLKVARPKSYYTISIIGLSILAWFGTAVNNLMLTYIVVTIGLLLPGLKHQGILYKYYQLLLHAVANVLRGLNGGGEKLKTK